MKFRRESDRVAAVNHRGRRVLRSIRVWDDCALDGMNEKQALTGKFIPRLGKSLFDEQSHIIRRVVRSALRNFAHGDTIFMRRRQTDKQ
jgi:hypothetical protein